MKVHIKDKIDLINADDAMYRNSNFVPIFPINPDGPIGPKTVKVQNLFDWLYYLGYITLILVS